MRGAGTHRGSRAVLQARQLVGMAMPCRAPASLPPQPASTKAAGSWHQGQESGSHGVQWGLSSPLGLAGLWGGNPPAKAGLELGGLGGGGGRKAKKSTKSKLPSHS